MLLDMDDEFQINQSATVKGQLITTTVAAAGATRVKDAGQPRDWGSGELVVPYLAVTAVAALNVGTSFQVDIVASSTIDLTGTPAILSTTGALLPGALLAGVLKRLPALLSGFLRRYLGAIFTVTGVAATTGAVVVGLTHKDARIQSYGDLANSL